MDRSSFCPRPATLVLLCAWAAGCSQSPTAVSVPGLPADQVAQFTAPSPAAAPEPRGAGPADVGPAPVVAPSREHPREPRRAEFLDSHPSGDARSVADWAVDSRDHGDLPFIIVDKVAARIHVFDADGRERASSPVLLGLARGDDSVPGIGEKKIADIRPEERTTPAGRFVAEMGENAKGEDILWVDYDAAVSMHRVRPTVKSERRLQRLASATAADNRISYGCINVPAAFYDRVVKPLFAPRDGIVYVLPETRPVRTVFHMDDIGPLARRR